MASYSPYTASGEINSRIEDKAAAVERVRRSFAGEDVEVGAPTAPPSPPPTGPGGSTCAISDTEPFLRLNVEAHDPAVMEQLRDRVLGIVRAG